MSSTDPQGAVNALTNKHYFKLKGTVPISYHVGCDFGRHGDGTLYFAPRKHVEKMEECYYSMFGSKPKQLCMSSLEKGDHPDVCTSKYLNQDGI